MIVKPGRGRIAALVIVTALTLLAVGGLSVRSIRDARTNRRPRLTTVTCGEVITRSIRVANDLTCAATNGLVVGASRITIDLNGHTLTGTTPFYGVEIPPGFSRATVTNGDVTGGWARGVNLIGTRDKVTRIRSFSNVYGIYAEGDDATVSANVVFLNVTNAISASADGVRMIGNVVRENDFGIVVFSGHSGAVVESNQTEHNLFAGIADGGSGTVLERNIANDNGVGGAAAGIDAHGDETAIFKANVANYNTTSGIVAYAGATDLGGDSAKGNTVAHQCVNVVCA